MKLYEPNASLVPQPGHVTTGEAANRQALQQFMALKGRISITTVYVVPAGDLALLRGDWHLAGTGQDGKPVEMSGKNVEVARRQPNGDWLFAIDHPFGAV
jgi:ketosteroid isomerase-like protein